MKSWLFLGPAAVALAATAPLTTAPAATTEPADTSGSESPWERVVPGGDCACADGGEFAFWTRHADPSNVVFFLEGGGACFDARTCAFTSDGSGTYDWNIGEDDDPALQRGIFELNNPDNPFADHSFVYVPYCTGDVHLGDVTREYSPELTVEHNGWVNGTAAISHLVEQFPDVAEIVVVGESAGSIAAPVYAGLIGDQLPDADITVFADGSGAYPDDPNLNAGIGGLWGAYANMPAWPVNEGLTDREWGIPRFWTQVGLHNPDIVLGRFDYAFDNVQATFMELTGGDTSNLQASIDANEAAIEAAGVVQYSYTAPGDEHTLVRKDDFYAMEVNGVSLVDWVNALIAGEPLDDVHCTECEAP